MTKSFDGLRDLYSDAALVKLARRFTKIILWGLKDGLHTHHYIYSAYYRNLSRLGCKVAWCDDTYYNITLISRTDLVFIHGTSKLIDLVITRTPFIVDFHVDQYFGSDSSTRVRLSDYRKRITEKEYIDSDAMQIDSLTYWSPSRRILVQPWGSDLLFKEFCRPVVSSRSSLVYWVGSQWKNDFWGNWDEIEELRRSLEWHGLKFIQKSGCNTLENIHYIRRSRIAPAIGGGGQVRRNYLACRFFKNISYGQFCISNVPASKKIVGDNALYDSNIADLIEKSLLLTGLQVKDIVLAQQQSIRNFTVAAHLFIIMVIALAED